MMPGVVAGFPLKPAVAPLQFTLTAARNLVLGEERIGYVVSGWGSIDPPLFSYLTGKSGVAGERGTITALYKRRTLSGSTPTSGWTVKMTIWGVFTLAELPATITIGALVLSKAQASVFSTASTEVTWSTAVTDAMLTEGTHTVVMSPP